MRQEAPLPPEWQCLEGLVRYVQQESNTTWTCSCPQCGGEVHNDGEWPDRCTLFVDTKATLFCRRCATDKIFPDQYGGPASAKPTLEELERWRQDRQQRELERKRNAERAIELLQRNRIWEIYHAQMDEEARKYWRWRGVPDGLQDWWQLGFAHHETFYRDGQPFDCKVATIPIFGAGWSPENLKMRLEDVPVPYAKYRYKYTGIPAHIWRSDPDESLEGDVLVVEGEIKAMVLAERAGSKLGIPVGLPGLKPGPTALESLKDAEHITLIVDPDGREGAWEIVKTLGREKCHVLVPSNRMGKIDDWILAANPSPRELRWIIRQSAKPAWL
jgi:hypothetical protein